ncbi:hypothetical protein [Tomitella cavernea]|uniref:Uncharacterized protein n=1 Tax=Tomitella cavernea TaxID=1387982 RepID=A0ABP9CZJ8_9ACTN|nr:hypothetical protein [Tomitella cavernea]
MADGSMGALSSIDAGTLTPVATDFGNMVQGAFAAISGSLGVAESGSVGIAQLLGAGLASIGN